MMDRGQSMVNKVSEADWRGDPVGAAKSMASQAGHAVEASKPNGGSRPPEMREDVSIESDAG
jgi:hypothetical protein